MSTIVRGARHTKVMNLTAASVVVFFIFYFQPSPGHHQLRMQSTASLLLQHERKSPKNVFVLHFAHFILILVGLYRKKMLEKNVHFRIAYSSRLFSRRVRTFTLKISCHSLHSLCDSVLEPHPELSSRRGRLEGLPPLHGPPVSLRKGDVQLSHGEL